MTRKHTTTRRKNQTKNKKIKAKRNNRTLKGGAGSESDSEYMDAIKRGIERNKKKGAFSRFNQRTNPQQTPPQTPPQTHPQINLKVSRFMNMIGTSKTNEPNELTTGFAPQQRPTASYETEFTPGGVLGSTPSQKHVALIIGDMNKFNAIERDEAEERLRRQAERREAEERLQTNTQSSATLSDRAQEIGGRTRDRFHQLGTQLGTQIASGMTKIASGIDEGREHLYRIQYEIAQKKMQKLKEKEQSILLEKQKLIENINDSKIIIYKQLRALRDKTEIELPEPLLSFGKMRERIESTINPRLVETENNLQSIVNKSKEASLILIKQHLNQFLKDFYSRNKRGNKPFPTYEDWVSNLHEDNVKGIYGVIDYRLYIENNDYLNIWNNNIEVKINQKQFSPRPSPNQISRRHAARHLRNSLYKRVYRKN